MPRVQTTKLRGADAAPTPGAPEARQVRAMFDRIAGRYDLLNRLLSGTLDRSWRRRAAAAALAGLARPRVLDLCTGTGDVAAALRAARPEAVLFGADFSMEMLRRAARKERGLRLVAADALALPFAAAAFDVVTVAFGVRNFSDRGRAFAEIARVLKPRGRLVILEFAPARRGLFGACRRLYCGFLLPRIAALCAQSPAAYRYLPASVDRFPPPAELLAELERAGLRPEAPQSLAFGVVALCSALKDANSA